MPPFSGLCANTSVHPDGTLIDYAVNPSTNASVSPTSDREIPFPLGLRQYQWHNRSKLDQYAEVGVE